MKAYIDSSVILRIIFGEKNALKIPKNISIFAISEIVKIECFRTMDRIRHALTLSDDEMTDRYSALHKTLKALHMIKLNDAIVERSCEPFPVTLKTLDAIHLSTAVIWKKEDNSDITFLTHDIQLSKAARALGFEVLGI